MICFNVSSTDLAAPTPGSGIEVTLENIDNKIYASRAYIGSNDQGGAESHILLDTTTSGVFITHSSIDDFKGNGIFNPRRSVYYISLSGTKNEIVNGRSVEGWDAKDEFYI